MKYVPIVIFLLGSTFVFGFQTWSEYQVNLAKIQQTCNK